MGKGDRKTRRGKITIGSYGKLRPRKKESGTQPEQVKEKNADKD